MKSSPSPPKIFAGGSWGIRCFSVVAFLVARGALEWMDTQLVEGKNALLLSAIHTAAIQSGLFELERQTIEALGGIKITVRMLEGE